MRVFARRRTLEYENMVGAKWVLICSDESRNYVRQKYSVLRERALERVIAAHELRRFRALATTAIEDETLPCRAQLSEIDKCPRMFD